MTGSVVPKCVFFCIVSLYMKIVTRIYIFCLLLVGIFCLNFSFSIYQQKKIITEIEQVIARDLDITANLSRLTTFQLQYSISLERIARQILEKRITSEQIADTPEGDGLDAAYVEEFNALYQQIQRSIESGINHSYSAKIAEEFTLLKNKLQKIKLLHENYLVVSEGMLVQMQKGAIHDLAVFRTSFTTLEDELNLAFESTLFEIQAFTAQSVEEIRQHERKVYQLYLFSGSLLLLLICIFLVLIIVRIRHSIHRAVRLAEKIEAGDRQIPMMDPGKDEIGKVVNAMQVMLQSITQAEDELKRIALTDSLTGIANRLKFNTTLEKEVERVHRYKQPLSLIMFDIDHFKKFNDLYGHDAGDTILVELTSLVGDNIRSTDLFARWGGEEFMILTVSTLLKDCSVLAENLRRTVEAHSFSQSRKVTCSFGVAEYHNEDIDTFLKRVDLTLYTSKEDGRNRVTTANLPDSGNEG